jgi:hypothetical protein
MCPARRVPFLITVHIAAAYRQVPVSEEDGSVLPHGLRQKNNEDARVEEKIKSTNLMAWVFPPLLAAERGGLTPRSAPGDREARTISFPRCRSGMMQPELTKKHLEGTQRTMRAQGCALVPVLRQAHVWAMSLPSPCPCS